MRRQPSLAWRAQSESPSLELSGRRAHTSWTARVLHIHKPVCQNASKLCSPVCTGTGDAASLTPLPPHPHPILPPSLCDSLCMCPVISPSAHNCPNLWCFLLQPQFRGSEILLSDCHNASASGKGRTPTCFPSLPSPLSSSPLLHPPHPHPPPRYPSLEVFFLPRCSTCAFTVSSRRPVSFFMKNPPDTRSLSVAPCSDSLFRTFTLLLLSISTLELT